MAYLDHAATTSLRPVAREAWLSAAAMTGNPSSLHGAGRAARRVVEESRERLAGAIGVAPSAIVFTSGGTESDNLAVVGTARARRAEDPRRCVVVTSAIEHKAVLEPVAALASEGFRSVQLGVDGAGVVDPVELKALLGDAGETVALVAVMWVNNEVGSIHPIAAVADVCADHGVPLHCDAVQAVGAVPFDAELASTTALSGHKAGGPTGVGVLVVRAGAAVQPLLHGGGHESGLRAGTLDTAGIASMAVAVEAAASEQREHAARVAVLRDELAAGLEAAVPDVVVNSSAAGHPGILNLTFPGCAGDLLMMLLDAEGVCVSTGSACTVGIPQQSHVLAAMGRDSQAARSALRFSLGWNSSQGDVAACLAVIEGAVARARRASHVRSATVSGASR